MSSIDFDVIAAIVSAELDDDDDAQLDVRHDVEHTPDAIPGEVWRAALIHVINTREKTP